MAADATLEINKEEVWGGVTVWSQTTLLSRKWSKSVSFIWMT